MAKTLMFFIRIMTFPEPYVLIGVACLLTEGDRYPGRNPPASGRPEGTENGGFRIGRISWHFLSGPDVDFVLVFIDYRSCRLAFIFHLLLKDVSDPYEK